MWIAHVPGKKHFRTSSALCLYIKKSVYCDMTDQLKRYDSRIITRIRQKIKEVLGRDCAMNDEMLLKNYTMTKDGELILILK
jgi:hypothetical protein